MNTTNGLYYADPGPVLARANYELESKAYANVATLERDGIFGVKPWGFDRYFVEPMVIPGEDYNVLYVPGGQDEAVSKYAPAVITYRLGDIFSRAPYDEIGVFHIAPASATLKHADGSVNWDAIMPVNPAVAALAQVNHNATQATVTFLDKAKRVTGNLAVIAKDGAIKYGPTIGKVALTVAIVGGTVMLYALMAGAQMVAAIAADPIIVGINLTPESKKLGYGYYTELARFDWVTRG